nr:unnamed protein product [Callosobruchus chinensis]
MIWHEYVSSIATAAEKQLGYLFITRKSFSPSSLLTLFEAQIRPSLEYCSRIWGAAAPTTFFVLDAVQRRAIRLIGDPALTCHLRLPPRQRAVDSGTMFTPAIFDMKPEDLREKLVGYPTAVSLPTV